MMLLTLIKPRVFRHLRKPGGGATSPPLFLRNCTADHPEIRHAYGSDPSDGLPIAFGTKYPENFRNYHFPGISRKVRNLLNSIKFID